MEKYYVVPLANEGKFSSDRPPGIPKIMTSPPLHIEGTLSLLVTSKNGAPPSCEPGSALLCLLNKLKCHVTR